MVASEKKKAFYGIAPIKKPLISIRGFFISEN